MRTAKSTWIIAFIFICLPHWGLLAQQHFQGRVYDMRSGLGLADVNVKVMDGGNVYAVTDSLGGFSVAALSGRIVLRFTKIGYEGYTGKYIFSDGMIRVMLQPGPIDIEEVQINTGYQWIPKERATGSFVNVDTEQLAATPGRSVIEKLDGIMPGLQFDKRTVGPTSAGSPVVTVRGMNTFLTGSSAPLIVVDNFPYEGDIENINPNDVESVTMLRDAAATSIWGARAGNGVLVINLKKPDLSGRTAVGWSSSLSVTQKPDLYYLPTIGSSEFVDVELFLYSKGHYRSALTGSNAHRTVFSPVVQALYDLEQGRIAQSDVDAVIAGARHHDYRDEMLEHFYRGAINQQHHLSISKRTGGHSLRFSAGIDRLDGVGNLQGGQANTRYSFNLNNAYRFSEKFRADLTVYYSRVDNHTGGGHHYPFNPGGGKSTLYPYARLIDERGQGLVIPQDLNLRYADTVARDLLLDWRFNPYEEINHIHNGSHTSKIQPVFTLRYNPISQLQLEAIYSGDFQYTKSGTRYGMESYYVRDQVNRYTQVNGNQIHRPLPVGDILSYGHSDLTGNKVRFHAKMDEHLLGNDRLSWILGGEVSDVQTTRSTQRVYGYDPLLRVSVPVDHVARHPLYLGSTGTIGSGQGFGRGVRRLVSFYGNASYVLQGKYILSGSARRDASNVFGAKANERWNPLWSVGLSWNMHREGFVREIDWISNLKLRLTHGHSGNLGGGTTSDRVVINYLSQAQYTNLAFANISSPPNLFLKWEDVRMNNYAIDFGIFDNRITGQIEFYQKRVTDLISRDPIDRTTGFNYMDRNVAGIDGEGLDFTLNLDPFKGPVTWKMGASFSYARDWVTVYKGGISSTSTHVSLGENSVMPVVGRSLVSVYSYRFAGLDPDNGDPLGYLNGEVSKDYAAIMRDSLHYLNYHGPARPLYFGFINNTIQYRGLSLFFNVTFRAGHYFRKNTIRYTDLFNSWNTHRDYERRWQQPGDENHTTVPSLVYPANSSRDNFYVGSEANVERGDVIRLQQIRLSYRLVHPSWRIKNVDIGVNINNLGVLWKATKTERDPDYQSIPPSRVITTNLLLHF